MGLVFRSLVLLALSYCNSARELNQPNSVKARDTEHISNRGLEFKITGGIAAEGEIPWQAALYVVTNHSIPVFSPRVMDTRLALKLQESGMNKTIDYFGGTLISDKHVLTVAHVIREYDENLNILYQSESVTVKLGTNNWLSEEIRSYDVQKVILHPEYDTYHFLWPKRNDIAIIKLVSSVLFTTTIHPIELPPLRFEIKEDAIAIVSGYGYYGARLVNSTIKLDYDGKLRRVRTRVLNNVECNKRRLRSNESDIAASQICTSSTIKKNTDLGICAGDDGGPLAIEVNENRAGRTQRKYVLIGLSCYISQTCQDNYMLFTRVSSFLPFIQKNLKL